MSKEEIVEICLAHGNLNGSIHQDAIKLKKCSTTRNIYREFRQIVMYVMYKHLDVTCQEIADYFGLKQGSTVTAARKKTQGEIDTYPETKKFIDSIDRDIRDTMGILKPCPFCRTNNAIIRHDIFENEDRYTPFCTYCSATFAYPSKTFRGARSKWDKR